MQKLFSALIYGLFLTPLTGIAAPLEPVTLQLKWFHQFQFAGYYAAVSKGFYAEEGLDVELVEGAIDRPPDQIVLEGKADFGIHDGGDLLFNRLQGRPLVAVAAIFQHSPYVIISKRSTGFHHPSDLVGQTIPITQDQGSAQILAMLRHEGVKVNSVFDTAPVHFVQHTWDFSPLIDEKIKAMAAYSIDLPSMQRRYQVDLVAMKPLDYGVDFYGDTLFTSTDYLNAHPDRVERFRRASLRGWDYALEHQEEMATLIQTLTSARQTRPTHQDLLDEATGMQELILQQLVEIGHLNPGRWEKMAKTYLELGLVSAINNLEGFTYSPDFKTQHQLESLKKLGFILAIVTLLGLIGLVWIKMLRSQVKSHTQSLTEELNRRRQLEIEQEANHRLLNSIVENIPHMIFMKRASDLSFVLFNKAGEDLLGYPRAELLGKKDTDFFPKEQADFFIENDRKVLSSSRVWDVSEERINTRHKGQRILHTKKLALCNNEGEPEFLLGISEDMTEAKQLQDELFQHRKHLEELVSKRTDELARTQFALDRTGIAISWYDTQTGRFLFVNDETCHLLGYSRDELLQMDVFGINPQLPPESVPPLIETLRTGNSIWRSDITLHRKDGSTLIVESTFYLSQISDGEECIIAFSRDITQRKAVERHNQRLLAILDQSPDLIVRRPYKGRFAI